jgi:small subunit ribosomal protein S20
MANIKSAIKRIRISERNHNINRIYKSTIKTFIKKYHKLIKVYKTNSNQVTIKEIKTVLSSIFSKIDKATKKNVFHKNTGSRKKSRLSKLLKNINSF